MLVEATPEGYREKGRFTPPNQSKKKQAGQFAEKAFAYPVIANGRLYIRDLETSIPEREDRLLSGVCGSITIDKYVCEFLAADFAFLPALNASIGAHVSEIAGCRTIGGQEKSFGFVAVGGCQLSPRLLGARSANSRLKAGAAHQSGEAGVCAQGVKQRIGLQPAERWGALLVTLLQHFERQVSLAKPDVDGGVT